ncbi:hypothetical protein SK128_009303, partial [Halocaridina rubra]
FEKIAEVVPQLDVDGKYKRILARFHQEVEKCLEFTIDNVNRLHNFEASHQ